MDTGFSPTHSSFSCKLYWTWKELKRLIDRSMYVGTGLCHYAHACQFDFNWTNLYTAAVNISSPTLVYWLHGLYNPIANESMVLTHFSCVYNRYTMGDRLSCLGSRWHRQVSFLSGPWGHSLFRHSVSSWKSAVWTTEASLRKTEVQEITEFNLQSRWTEGWDWG